MFWLGYAKIDNELQFDWIEGRYVSCWRLLHGPVFG
jgi:hypothetical protein